MMKTDLDVVQAMFDIGAVSPLKTAITGGFYKYTRPQNARGEDVVFNSLPITKDGKMQRAVGNVNIYVNNLELRSADKKTLDRSQPDVVRLKTLTDIAVQVYRDYWGYDFNIEIDQAGIIAENEIFQHFMNLRIIFNTLNR